MRAPKAAAYEMRSAARSPFVGVFLAALAILATACGDDNEAASTLAGVCPDPVVIQTDWNPESEHGGAYELLGAERVIDMARLRVSGPLLDGGRETGVGVEIRAGGPAIGFRQVSEEMHRDPSILLGFVNTDEAIQHSATQPTVAVLAPLELNPQIIMWDPETYPDFETIADIGRTNTLVLYQPSAVYMEFLLGTGVLKPSQVEGSYDGTPARFLASGGAVAQQGFASSEPYIYEHELPAWGRPVAFQLIHETGYEIYSQALAVRAADLGAQRACLERLVPILQRAQVAFIEEPARTNRLIVDLVGEYDNGWVYSEGVAEFSVTQQRALGLVGNGPDATLGNFDL
jgi:hypothetical protein